MFAATVAGIYPKVEEAMQAMGHGFDAEYQPDAERAAIYAKRYGSYKKFGAFIEAQTLPEEVVSVNRNTQTEATHA